MLHKIYTDIRRRTGELRLSRRMSRASSDYVRMIVERSPILLVSSLKALKASLFF
jgi:hypothetical protein